MNNSETVNDVMKSKVLKIITKKKRFFILMVFLVFLCFTSILLLNSMNSKKKEAEVITISTLEKIINVSELSTFTAVYNGIATVNNEKKTEKIDYYVSYEAKVDAGIDFEKLEISVDNENKIIEIKIPEIYITEINVDISSLDFIFMNDKANSSTVSEEAFKACEADVQAESKQQMAIYELAKQNAVNILTALTKPIVEQLDAEYGLKIS